MHEIERIIERVLLAARWLLVIFYFGLAIGLAVYAFAFTLKLVELVSKVFVYTGVEMILAMLGLIDAALVASLLVMVMLSGYESFISRLDDAGEHLGWLSKLDTSSLKVKLAASIVAISSIHLLQIFLNLENYSNDKILWFTVIHITFLASALLLGMLDRVSNSSKSH